MNHYELIKAINTSMEIGMQKYVFNPENNELDFILALTDVETVVMTMHINEMDKL